MDQSFTAFLGYGGRTFMTFTTFINIWLGRSWQLMTVTLLLGDKNKGWCEDCWASYPCSNGGLATALWQTSSWQWEGQAVVPSPFKLCTNQVLGDLYMPISCNPSFWEVSPGGLGFDSHKGKNSNINSGLLYVQLYTVYRKYLYPLRQWCYGLLYIVYRKYPYPLRWWCCRGEIPDLG